MPIDFVPDYEALTGETVEAARERLGQVKRVSVAENKMIQPEQVDNKSAGGSGEGGQ